MAASPWLSDASERPEKGDVVWLTAADGAKLRIGVWPGGTRGTVLIFPGRTEYIEKYGLTAIALQHRGFATAVIDWRGQGLSDRLTNDPLLGHVDSFGDFQMDVAAFMEAVRTRDDLPGPKFLFTHSMGGAIGLRALMNGLDVRAAAFSAPMWRIAMRPILRPVSWGVSSAAHVLGLGRKPLMGIDHVSYVATAPFEDNLLTSDPERFQFMKRHLVAHPYLGLGSPSLSWLFTAMLENHDFRTAALPELPALVAAADLDEIVDPERAREIAQRWPSARFVLYEGCRHEIIMERPEYRDALLDAMTELYISAG